MNKKAQFYIITAVIILALTFSFFKPKLTFKKDDTFRQLYENYIVESSFAANTGNLMDFTKKFVEYANTKDPDFGLAYLYVQNDNISVFTLIKKTIFINEFKLSFNETLVIEKENSTTITMNENQYVFNTSEVPQIDILFYSESENARKVYVKDE